MLDKQKQLFGQPHLVAFGEELERLAAAGAVSKQHEPNARELLVGFHQRRIDRLEKELAEEKQELEKAKQSDPNAPVIRCPVCRGYEKPYWSCDC